METDNELELDFELQFVKLYMDPKIRDLTAGHVQEWMFTTDITKAIIAATSNPAFENKLINPDTLVAFIEKTYKKHRFTQDEKFKIKEIATEYKPVQDSEIGVFQFLITEFIKQRYISKGIDLYLKNDKEAEKFLSLGVEFSFSNSEFIDPSVEGVILALKEASNPKGKIITSSISLINKSSSYGGYKYGDLVMVVAPPKVGKTTLLCQEAVHSAKNGIKVAHVCLGDMSAYDLVCKYISNIQGQPMEVVIDDPVKYLSTCTPILENIKCICYPAAEITTRELVAQLRRLKKKFDYDVVIIDYDSNLVPDVQTDNMYQSGGVMYSALKGFAEKDRCVVLIGSQPKISDWDKELLPMSSASESSRKQHAIDYMITMGRNLDTKSLGTLHIPCVRRGEGMVSVRIHFNYKNSRIEEVTGRQYNEMLAKFKGEVKDTQSSFFDPLADELPN